MFCVGNDDGQHWDKGSVRGVHRSRLSVKGKMHRADAALDSQPSVM